MVRAPGGLESGLGGGVQLDDQRAAQQSAQHRVGPRGSRGDCRYPLKTFPIISLCGEFYRTLCIHAFFKIYEAMHRVLWKSSHDCF